MTTPDRSERERCWAVRDKYFACLDAASVVLPGRDSNTCTAEKKDFESKCSKTWAEYFLKRRVLEARQKLTADGMSVKDGFSPRTPAVDRALGSNQRQV